MANPEALIHKICSQVNKWSLVHPEYEQDSPRYWRWRFFVIFLFASLIAGSLFFVPLLALAFKQNLWELATLELAVFLCAWALLPLAHHLKFKTIAICGVAMSYIIGIAITVTLSPLSGGPFWLFASAVLAGALLGIQAAVNALAINVIIIVGIGWLISDGWYGQAHPFLVSPERGVIMALSFIFLNSVMSITVAVLMKYVEQTYRRQKETRESLLRERGHLMSVRDALENEVTARNSAQIEFMRSEERLKALINSLPEAVYFKDLKLHNIIVNSAYEDLFERHASEIAGKRDDEFMPPALARQRQESDLTTLNSKSSSRFIEYLKSVGGRERLLDTTKTPFKNYCGQAAGIIGVSRIIAGRQTEEQELLIPVEHYLELIERLSEGLMIVSNDPLKIAYASDSLSRIMGFEARELQSLTTEQARELVHPKDQASFFQRLEAVHGGQSFPSHFEARLLHKDDSILWMKILFARVSYRGSARILVSLLDITESKKLEHRLQQAQKMEIVGKLASGIAHDFNNILGVIIGYSELMDMFDLGEDDRVRNNLQEVLNAAYRGRDLIKQILNFSRQKDTEKRPLLLAPLIRESVKFLRASLPSTIEIHQRFEAEQGAILADATQIFQVLMNLCTNAAQSMSDRPGILKIGLTMKSLSSREELKRWDLPPGEYLKLSVSDTGTGMSPEVAMRVFEPFFTTKRAGEGAGLGLAVVNAIVKNHGGAVIVESHPGKGTTFHVCLPSISSDADFDQIQRDRNPLEGSERVLFVDDETALANYAKDALSTFGYDVVSVTSSPEALRLFHEDPVNFDIVVTDLTMPHLTGITLAREILKLRPDTPIVLCSGKGDSLEWEQIKDLGVRQFISKPFDITALSNVIRKALADES